MAGLASACMCSEGPSALSLGAVGSQFRGRHIRDKLLGLRQHRHFGSTQCAAAVHKNVKIMIPAIDGVGPLKQKHFPSYKELDHTILMNNEGAVGLAEFSSPEEDMRGFDDLESGGLYLLVRSEKANGIQNLINWRRHMWDGQEEVAAERLVAIAKEFWPNEEITRVERKKFKSPKGFDIMELDAVVLIGHGKALIASAKALALKEHVEELHSRIVSLPYYIKSGGEDFQIFKGRKLVGCIVTQSFPSDEDARSALLYAVKYLPVLLEAPNGCSLSIGNSLYHGKTWETAFDSESDDVV